MKDLKRRKEKKTDYRKRLALLKSGKPRLVVRRSSRYINIQIIAYKEGGDETLLEINSKILGKFGWKNCCVNVPAAYLTGLVVGAKMKEKGINNAVLDLGLQASTKQCRLYALAKGISDSGINIPLGKEVLPSADRIQGKHIVKYRNSPDFVSNFEAVKKAITENINVTEKPKAKKSKEKSDKENG